MKIDLPARDLFNAKHGLVAGKTLPFQDLGQERGRNADLLGELAPLSTFKIQGKLFHARRFS